MSDHFRRGPLLNASSLGWCLALVCGLVPAALRAQDAAVEADFESRYTASADLASRGGTVSQWNNSLDLSLPVAGNSAYGLSVDLIADRFDFDFGDFGGFLDGKSAPLVNASVFTLQPTFILTPAGPWSYIASALVEYAGADGASTDGAMLWGGSLAVADQLAPSLKLGLGIEGMQQMKAPPWFFPFPIIDWRISRRWSLTSTDGETGRLAYAVSTAVRLFGQLEFQEQDFRLARSASIPSGIVRYESYPLSVGVQWKPFPHCTASAFGGEALDQDYRFEFRNGALRRASGTHAPLIGTLELDGSF